jgi:hypothetical protein
MRDQVEMKTGAELRSGHERRTLAAGWEMLDSYEMHALIRFSIPLLLAVLFAGCVSRARRLEGSAVSKIKVGSTTTTHVEEIFGRPSETVIGPNETAVARYHFRQYRLRNDVRARERYEYPGDILFRTLSLRYGPSRVIEQKLHDESVTPVRRYNEWLVSGPTLMPENINFLQKDRTTRAELIERLGEPTSQTFELNGRPVLIWVGARERRGAFADTEVRQLIVLINERQIVKDFAVVLQDMPGVRGNWR